ncbi:MAG: hypothetical protein M0019_09780 [Actinomycetota bacterium]|nr:hypothetical protein [Actinomycetota bacterium]
MSTIDAFDFTTPEKIVSGVETKAGPFGPYFQQRRYFNDHLSHRLFGCEALPTRSSVLGGALL